MAGGSRPDGGGFYYVLKERAEAAGLGGELIWTGYASEERISEILLAADLFLAPFEGGISSRRSSLMAALAYGLPVVSSPSQVPTKYFRGGENYFSVPFGDAGALAAAAAGLMEDSGRRARLADGALALAEIFSWPAIALRTRDFLETVMNGGPLAGPGT
jgi:glycosyltransferase involved in cell wall biosynthesis